MGTLELLHAPGEQRFLRGRREDPQPWGPHEEYPDSRTTPGLYRWFFVLIILGGTMLVDGCWYTSLLEGGCWGEHPLRQGQLPGAHGACWHRQVWGSVSSSPQPPDVL